jgi:malate dehydrogenase (oxaloacetate-decarboxylating)(NADP+)
MRRPVHIFQLGASVEEMVNMTAIAVLDAQQKEKRARSKRRKK